MATLQEEGEAFQEAARDLAYELFKSLGMLRLIRRLGAQPKAWLVEREERDHAASSPR